VANDLPQIALVGPPNVGKSSLFNALVKRFGCRATRRQNAQTPALVSPRRGTTRDYLTAMVSLDEFQCELVDTAGIDEIWGDRPSSDWTEPTSRDSAINEAAHSFACERRERATIRAHCAEAREAAVERQLFDLPRKLEVGGADVLVLTKADLLPSVILHAAAARQKGIVFTSSLNGLGLDELRSTFVSLLSDNESAECGQVVAATANRCRESVRSAEGCLRRAAELVLATGGNELVAVELRAALDEIGRVVGAVYTDDLLDRIFKTFCIGK
jgi:tRNA modification GTPase